MALASQEGDLPDRLRCTAELAFVQSKLELRTYRVQDSLFEPFAQGSSLPVR
jgi:hypothetical protein